MAEGNKVSAGNRRKVQVRKERVDAFSDAKKQIFLDHLASCCTVKTSAAAAGVSAETVNNHRRKDPVFDEQCEQALKVGYDNLDAAMLARAARGGSYEPGPDAAEAPGPETVDTMLGLHLLQLRRKPMGQRTGRAGYEPKRVSEKELNESLLAKLEVLHRRRRLKREQVRKLKTPAQAKAALAAAGNGDSC
jgi:hypothetical protein